MDDRDRLVGSGKPSIGTVWDTDSGQVSACAVYDCEQRSFRISGRANAELAHGTSEQFLNRAMRLVDCRIGVGGSARIRVGNCNVA
jgi:hypothetical protein